MSEVKTEEGKPIIRGLIDGKLEDSEKLFLIAVLAGNNPDLNRVSTETRLNMVIALSSFIREFNNINYEELFETEASEQNEERDARLLLISLLAGVPIEISTQQIKNNIINILEPLLSTFNGEVPLEIRVSEFTKSLWKDYNILSKHLSLQGTFEELLIAMSKDNGALYYQLLAVNARLASITEKNFTFIELTHHDCSASVDCPSLEKAQQLLAQLRAQGKDILRESESYYLDSLNNHPDYCYIIFYVIANEQDGITQLLEVSVRERIKKIDPGYVKYVLSMRDSNPPCLIPVIRVPRIHSEKQ